MLFKFPSTQPNQSPEALWSLQQHLLSVAESLLGPRSSMLIYQPAFKDVGVPQLFWDVSEKGVFARLSPNAAGYWPTTVYELAHETIHMLHPIRGYASYLEEGIAVLFSELCSSFTDHPMEDNVPAYRRALSLVKELVDPFAIAKQICSTYSSLSNIDSSQLREIVPTLSQVTAEELCKKCIP